MSVQNPKLTKKVSSQRARVHIHFDTTDDMETQFDGRQSLVSSKMKRQSQQLEGQRHQKIVKKPKKDNSYHFREQQLKTQASTMPSVQQRQLRSQPTAQFLFNQQKQVKMAQQALKQQEEQFQIRTVKLLKQFLFHPNLDNNKLINAEIVNKWILDIGTTHKLKSFLMLYMILYQLDHVQFGFKKVVYTQSNPFTKTISVQRVQNKFQPSLGQDDSYQRFREGQLQKYLSHYLEWLIWVNEARLRTAEGNQQFWALALNNCEKVASQLMSNKSSIQRQKNVFISLFLLNAQDAIFRSTVQIPKTFTNLLFMKNEDISMLPQCHWVLGVNLSVKYFYKKDLSQRLRQSLSVQNLRQKQVGQFYHQFQLLYNYSFKDQPNIPKLPKSFIFNPSPADNILEWLSIQSDCRKVNKEFQLENKSLSQRVSSSLLYNIFVDTSLLKQNLLVMVELLQRERYLQNDEKDSIISSILYKNQKIASKLGNQFTQAIDYLQRRHETLLPALFQRLSNQYSLNYKHRLLSEQSQIQYDLLTQLRHLVNIDLRYRDLQIRNRVHIIVSSFTVITHWNKEIVKSFVNLLQRLASKINAYIFDKLVSNQSKIQEQSYNQQKGNGNQGEQRKYMEKQLQQLYSLIIMLKINLKIQLLTTANLAKIIQLIKLASRNQSIIPFQSRTVGFMKKNILSTIFGRAGSNNQSLLWQIKRMSLNKKENSEIQQENIKQNLMMRNSQSQNPGNFETSQQKLLEQLQGLANGTEYFYDQVRLLREQAKLCNKSDNL